MAKVVLKHAPEAAGAGCWVDSAGILLQLVLVFQLIVAAVRVAGQHVYTKRQS